MKNTIHTNPIYTSTYVDIHFNFPGIQETEKKSFSTYTVTKSFYENQK